MKLKTGDKVKIIAGKDKGKTGAIIQVFPDLQRVVVEGLNIAVKHIKKRGNQPGQKIEFPAALHVSNVMIIDSKTNKRTRVGYKLLAAKEGRAKKVRIAKKSGEVIS